jgi:oxygen-independent coproporphyrinogen-3 oxidase
VTVEAEVTRETNPETATPERLEAFLQAGVNRISFGVQSFDDGELARLGRIHSAARAAEAIQSARRAGCGNVSLDLMLWLPGQSPLSWRRTVDRAISLGSDHLSLYLLELYPNAPLKESIARAAAGGGEPTPDWGQAADDEAADMYLDGLARLDAAGFEQYEISNVARPGRQSRHNLKYWQSGARRGFGCGAHSTIDGERWKNVSGTDDYVVRVTTRRSVRQDVQTLRPAARIEEGLFTGLRLSTGIDRGNFLARYGVDPWARYGPVLQPYVDDGYMWTDGRRFGLSRTGMLVANEILAVFV